MRCQHVPFEAFALLSPATITHGWTSDAYLVTPAGSTGLSIKQQKATLDSLLISGLHEAIVSGNLLALWALGVQLASSALLRQHRFAECITLDRTLLIIENSSLDGGSGEAPRPWSRATTELSLRLAENHEAVENFADAAKEYQQLIRAASEDPMVLRKPQQLPTMYSFLALALKRGGQLARAEPVYLAALQLTSAFGDEGQRKHILQMLLSLYLDMAFEKREKIGPIVEELFSFPDGLDMASPNTMIVPATGWPYVIFPQAVRSFTIDNAGVTCESSKQKTRQLLQQFEQGPTPSSPAQAAAMDRTTRASPNWIAQRENSIRGLGKVSRNAAKRAGVLVRTCHSCGAAASASIRLKECARCHEVEYCSVGCQKSDWKAHKKICGKGGPVDRSLAALDLSGG
ncbi:hypothetical protein EMIHUDRAFT_254328 [Emiliania huxleyi CCMP1516]|uniref:MYND-type domain-containing protein n=2 Tax=Emiliania huxleyi TaxID=2903 RepID=A0A0D3JV43_EMIH1|nr:hypothetical protein EMIHUDRAFT_254328 [Emiliania huxleyi CCMP1516]EOD27378.1 hypothetical protein EMIHUDRAFT_254328 [Emiliania huxleyi CCMP1516]|eukprot:XP_005779807.1 hypothetical protein EMIHUDRAFT_254328 [Emiliania huxleyi CCMP1516]